MEHTPIAILEADNALLKVAQKALEADLAKAHAKIGHYAGLAFRQRTVITHLCETVASLVQKLREADHGEPKP